MEIQLELESMTTGHKVDHLYDLRRYQKHSDLEVGSRLTNGLAVMYENLGIVLLPQYRTDILRLRRIGNGKSESLDDGS